MKNTKIEKKLLDLLFEINQLLLDVKRDDVKNEILKVKENLIGNIELLKYNEKPSSVFITEVEKIILNTIKFINIVKNKFL